MTSSSPPGVSRGDVILVPYPFTDLTGSKQRPAVIVSDTPYNLGGADVIVAQVSSNIAAGRPDDCVLTDWAGAGLQFPSVVRPKLATLQKTVIRQTLGSLNPVDMVRVDANLKWLLRL